MCDLLVRTSSPFNSRDDSIRSRSIIAQKLYAHPSIFKISKINHPTNSQPTPNDTSLPSSIYRFQFVTSRRTTRRRPLTTLTDHHHHINRSIKQSIDKSLIILQQSKPNQSIRFQFHLDLHSSPSSPFNPLPLDQFISSINRSIQSSTRLNS